MWSCLVSKEPKDATHNIIKSNGETDINYKLNDGLDNKPHYAFISELDDGLVKEPNNALANKEGM